MGELLRKLWRWLSSGDSRSSLSTYGNPDLHPIDTEQLAKDLDVEAEAKRLGEKDIPSTSDLAPTGIEAKIIQVVEKARQEYANWATLRVGDLNKTIEKTDLESDARKALQADAQFERQAGALIEDHRSSLILVSKAVEDINKEYVEFQKTHGLSNPAQIPSSAQAFSRHIVLAALIVGEGCVNSGFFAQGMWGGLAEGLFFAIIFAFANIFLAYWYGRLIVPQLFHISLFRKLLGILGMAIALTAITALAFLIAHYRDAVSGGATDAARVAWETLRSSPFDLKDAKSVLLCGLSIAFAVFAVFDAFILDDPYPGYGAITRRRDRAIQDHETELAGVREKLEESKAAAIREVDALEDKLRTSLHQLDTAISQKTDTETKLDNAFVNVDNCLTALLGKFRDNNRFHRKTPTPQYFNTHPQLRAVARPNFATTDDRKKYANQKLKLQEAQNGIPRVRANIERSFGRLYDSLKPLDEHFTNVFPRPA